MREVGSFGPDFALPSHDGGMIKLSRLVDQNDHVVIVFFLVAGSPGCTREICGFRDLYDEYRRRRVGIVGISPDPLDALAEFARENQVPFDLCSDMDHRIAGEWGTYSEGRQARSTFVINGKGQVSQVFPRVNVHTHPAEVLPLIPLPDGDGALAPVQSQNLVQSQEPVQAQVPAPAPAGPLGATDVVLSLARASLQLLVTHVEAGGPLPADVRDFLSRLAKK